MEWLKNVYGVKKVNSTRHIPTSLSEKEIKAKTEFAFKLCDEIDECLDRIRFIHNYEDQLAYVEDGRELLAQLKLVKSACPYLAIDSFDIIEEKLDQAEVSINCLKPKCK